eukprot:TRINITY_DN60949_c0_g1_i1.p1 TRINITY_DN60949_c0_g1~~TRINITY_DN60949_c0_g1_i1.p1  ORF type:complete len:603 (+),score=119.76 TRINITY_DN60949_c0_g1_i1:87-1895(+)
MSNYFPLQELLRDDVWRQRVWKHTAKEDCEEGDIGFFAATSSLEAETERWTDVSSGSDAALATERLAALHAEPWNWTISRLLIQESPTCLRSLAKLYGLLLSGGDFDRSHWTVAAVRNTYEHVFVRETSNLLRARASPDGRGSDSGVHDQISRPTLVSGANSANSVDGTPLMHCALEGRLMTSKALLAAGADVHRRDAAGRSALHFALLQHEVDVARLLLAAVGTGVMRCDAVGHHPADIARVHGLSMVGLQDYRRKDKKRNKTRKKKKEEKDEAIDGAGERFNENDVGEEVRKDNEMENSEQRGEMTEVETKKQKERERKRVEAQEEEKTGSAEKEDGADCGAQWSRRIRRRCDGDVGGTADLSASVRPLSSWLCLPSQALFTCDFVALKRPLLLRGAAQHFSSADCWSREALAEHVGSSQVDVSTIPYSEDFGERGAALSMTLERFLEVEIDLFAPSGIPYYVFTYVDDDSQPLLARLFRSRLGGLPEHLPPPFQGFRATAVQFSVGGAGSGSPLHFHDSAFNILLAGRKHWWLWPPANAAMSRVHPSQLLESDALGSSPPPAFDVMQDEGDVLFIPNGWGHAVLNSAAHTVCAAVEIDV